MKISSCQYFQMHVRFFDPADRRPFSVNDVLGGVQTPVYNIQGTTDLLAVIPGESSRGSKELALLAVSLNCSKCQDPNRWASVFLTRSDVERMILVGNIVTERGEMPCT